MAWEVQESYIDSQIGHHVVKLQHRESGAQHLIQIVLSADACPHCGTPTPKNNLGDIDPRQVIADTIAKLEQSHQHINHYALKHRIQIRKK